MLAHNNRIGGSYQLLIQSRRHDAVPVDLHAFLVQALGMCLTLGEQVTVFLVLTLTFAGMAGIVIPGAVRHRGRNRSRLNSGRRSSSPTGRRSNHGLDAGVDEPARKLCRNLRGRPLGGGARQGAHAPSASRTECSTARGRRSAHVKNCSCTRNRRHSAPVGAHY